MRNRESTSSPPASAQRLRRCRPLPWLTEELRNRHFKHLCETVEHVHSRIFLLPLKPPDVGAVYFGLMCEPLLR
jgi:hypothetical protein